MTGKTGMEKWWNDSDRLKLKYSQKNLSQCHFVRHKSQIILYLLANSLALSLSTCLSQVLCIDFSLTLRNYSTHFDWIIFYCILYFVRVSDGYLRAN